MRIAFRTTAHREKLKRDPSPTTYVMTINVHNLATDDRENQIKRIFESPLGPFVSEATLTVKSVLVVLHVPAHKMKTVYSELSTLLPGAVVTDIHPRELDYCHHRAKS